MLRRLVLMGLVGLVVGLAVPVAGQQVEPEWVRTGGPLGGLGYDVRMHPDDPDIMFVTDAFAGVFRSTDGGVTWSPSNEGITTRSGLTGDAIPVFCLTIDPNDPDTLWAGTQHLRGIYRSDDGGLTWTEKVKGIGEVEGITFRGITVDPSSSDIVYAAGEISSWTWAGEERMGQEFDMTMGVVYKTTDAGENWEPVWRGDNLARYVLIDPSDTDTVYVSTGIFDREAANSDPQARTPGGVGVIKSTDGGATWSEMTSGLSNLYVGSLVMHPSDPQTLLAATGNNRYFADGGVYLTEDGGESWRHVLWEHEEPQGRVGNLNSVEFSAADPSIAYAGGAGAVYRSEDGGRTWDRMSPEGLGWGPPGVRAGFPIDFQADPDDTDRLFVNNYGGGNFVSTDGGRTWTLASDGYTGAQARDIVADPTAPGRVFVAARSGLFSTSDGGATWRGHAYPNEAVLEWNVVTTHPNAPERMLATNNWDGAVSWSVDGGATWTRGQRLFAEEPPAAVRALAFAPSDPAVVYAGAGSFFSAGGFDPALPSLGMLRSEDGGKSWKTVGDAVSRHANVAALAVHPARIDVVFAATGEGLLRSADAGESWEPVPTVPRPVHTVAFHPEDPAIILAGSGGVTRSEDGGASWAQAASGLAPESAVVDFAFSPIDSAVVFAADAFSGVFRSSDFGRTWESINNGLRTRAVGALAISVDGRHLYAATEGEGVFRLDLDGSPPPTAPPLPEPSARPSAEPPTAEEPPPDEGTPRTTPPADVPPAADPGQVAPAPSDDGGGAGGVIALVAGGTALAALAVVWGARHKRST